MKRTVLIAILLVLTLGLFAQSGFFDLSYGDSYQKAKDTLTKGDSRFVEDENEGGVCTYLSPVEPDIDHLALYFDDGKLVSWKVYFGGYYDDDIYDFAMQWATDFHEAEGVWDDELYCYRWDFDATKSLFIGYNADEWLVAEYYDDAYSQYGEFNW